MDERMNRRISRYMFKKRKKKMMSRGDVVKVTGLSLNTVKNIENIEFTGGMNINTLKLLCECYDTTLSRMFKFLKL